MKEICVYVGLNCRQPVLFSGTRRLTTHYIAIQTVQTRCYCPV